MRYGKIGGPLTLVEQPLCQLVALLQDSKYLGSSPPPGTQAMQAIQDLPPTPVPGELPVKPPPLVTTRQLQLTLTDTSAASNLTRPEAALAAGQEAATAAAAARVGPSPSCC